MDVATLKARLHAFSEVFTRAQLSKPASGAHFVLFVGDEGAILVHIENNVVLSRQFVPDSSDQNLEELRQSLSADNNAPVLLVIDSMDQTFVQQTLPPISQFSLPKLIRRRLDRDFGPNDIKGYVLLGREPAGRRDWSFMMVSVERNAQLSRWLDFLSALPNRFQGIYLTSVETEVVLKKLKYALDTPTDNASEWTFFVSHNKVGGFRQVVLRNGRVLFTRMTQPVGEATPEVIAGNIEQEMLSTIEYLRRLSFTGASGLDIYIIASSAIKAAIDTSKFPARNIQMLTPYEVAQRLNLEGATQPTDQFGDVVLAAIIGSSRKHVLKLLTPEMQKIELFYQLFTYQRLAAAAAGLAMLIYAGGVAFDMYATYAARQDLNHQKTVEESRLHTLKAQIADRHLDVDAANDMAELYQQLQHESLSPVPFVDAVETVIKPPIVVRQFHWSLQQNKPSAGAAPKITAVLSLEFPGITSVDAFRVISKKILNDAKKTFAGYDVAFTRLPAGYAESDKTEMTFGDNAAAIPAASSGAPLEADLTITGDIAAVPGGK